MESLIDKPDPVKSSGDSAEVVNTTVPVKSFVENLDPIPDTEHEHRQGTGRRFHQNNGLNSPKEPWY